MLNNPRNIQYRNVSDPPFIAVNGQAAGHMPRLLYDLHRRSQKYTTLYPMHIELGEMII